MGRRMSRSVLVLTTLAFSLLVGDVVVLSAQDQPTPPTPQTKPAPQTKTTTPRPIKKTRGQVSTTTGDQTAPAQTETPAQTPAQPETPAQPMPAQTTRMTPTEQPDLSGTYAGTFTCDALGLTGDTTLTITGNQFTTADGKTGRIVASKTGGYTAVALQTGGDVGMAASATGAPATPPTIVSLRARKSGNRLTLTSAPGTTMQCSFSTSRNVARGRRSQKVPAATGTEVASPAEAGPTPAEVTTPKSPRSRRGSSRRTTTPSTMPNPTTMPSPETQPTQPVPAQTPSPNPEPSPSPSPRPTPRSSPTPNPSPAPEPSPSPGGSPSPEPAPTATPNPTPSPSPSPSPRPRGQ